MNFFQGSRLKYAGGERYALEGDCVQDRALDNKL